MKELVSEMDLGTLSVLLKQLSVARTRLIDTLEHGTEGEMYGISICFTSNFLNLSGKFSKKIHTIRFNVVEVCKHED